MPPAEVERAGNSLRLALGLVLVALALAPALAGAQPQWRDMTKFNGVHFREAGELHHISDEELRWPAFPEIMGGGACWFDYDNDGFDDLYLVSQQYNPHNPYVGPWAASVDPHSKLFHNDRGSFTDVSAAAGVDTRAFGYGCSAADFDGDGCVDLFVSVFGASELYRNRCDGTFANVTAGAGWPLGVQDACGDFACMSTSSAWADYDRDGDLDLFVANYVDTDLVDARRGPNQHVAQDDWLLRNDGDGTFTEVAAEAGVAGDADGKSLGCIWFDYDLDGWPDLFVANDERQAYLYRNNRDGTFASVAPQAGVNDTRGNMGVATGDYDGDGYPDLFVTHYQSEEAGFYRNRGDGTFEDRSGEDDLHRASDFVGWGTAFVDVDRDGDLDIVAVNGHTEWQIEDNYGQPNLVFLNEANPKPYAPRWDRVWVDASEGSGPGITIPRVHRGAAFADHDLDGDVDMALVSNNNETAQVLEGLGVTNGWLYVRLTQPGMNRFAIGARLALEAGGLTRWREVQAGSSYLSQNTLTQEFGLGALAQADRVRVVWPDGGTTIVGPIAKNQTIRIDRASGTYAVEPSGVRPSSMPPAPAAPDAEPPGGPAMPGVLPPVLAPALLLSLVATVPRRWRRR